MITIYGNVFTEASSGIGMATAHEFAKLPRHVNLAESVIMPLSQARVTKIQRQSNN